MAALYDPDTAHPIAQGLQGSARSNDAINAALRAAKERNRTVWLEDDDGDWLIGPRGGVRRFTAALKAKHGFSMQTKTKGMPDMAAAAFPALLAAAGVSRPWLAAQAGRSLSAVDQWCAGSSNAPGEVVAWLQRRVSNAPPKLARVTGRPPQSLP